MGRVWRVAGTEGFIWREFDAISVIFDPRSGETHLLDPMAREVLDLLVEAPRTREELSDMLVSVLGGVRGDYDERVMQAIVEFDRLGLVQPVM